MKEKTAWLLLQCYISFTIINFKMLHIVYKYRKQKQKRQLNIELQYMYLKLHNMRLILANHLQEDNL